MLGGARAFFGLVAADPSGLIEKIYDLAHFWKVPPQVVMDTPLADLWRWLKHAGRIGDQIAKALHER